MLGFLIITGCDVEYPEEWEAPRWQLPLTIPLVDQIYNVSDISSDDNQIRIDTSSQTFIIGVDTTLLDSGVIKIEESFFIVPGTTPVSEEVMFNIASDGFEIPSINLDPINLNSIIGGDLGDCLPYTAVSGYNNTIILDAIPITEGLENLSEYIQSIDYVRIKSGTLSLKADNQFPFNIDRLQLLFQNIDECPDLDCIGASTWESLTLEDISSGTGVVNNTVITDLMTSYPDGRKLPSSITPGNSIEINDDGSANANPCQYYVQSIPDPAFPIPPIDSGTCTSALLSSYPELSDASVDWVDADGTGAKCWIYYDGWDLTAMDNTLSIYVEFNDVEMQDLVGHIVYETETTTEQPVALNESISLISAHIEDVDDADTNKIKINVSNNLFTPVDIELSIENILDDFGQPFSYQTQVVNGSNLEDDIDLSDNDVRGPDVGNFESLVINNKISFDSENTQIVFDQDYSLNINSIFTTPIKFDELYVDLQDFSTPDIDMASVPAGFGDIGLPTLRFNLYMYNEISAPLRLNLDLMGITEDDTIKIHVEPALKFPAGYDGIDSTTIAIYSDTLEVQGSTFTDYYKLEAPIDTLFSRDEIKVSGNATLNGESSLKPGKSFWGDVGIELRPLTIVFPENVTFNPQDKTELSLDEDTRENINNGLVSADLFIEVGNSMPIGATLNMLTSDSTFFPLCFDSLKTGIESNQVVSDTCWTLIEKNYSPDSLYVTKGDDGEIVSTEFLNADTTTCFIGKLISLDLGIPTNLDENGFILDKSITYNNILLDTAKMRWLTSNDKLYISPIINNVRTSIDTLPGYVTFHTIDYLQIRSFLTLVMDSKIVTGNSDEE